jgi:hypothetical protein
MSAVPASSAPPSYAAAAAAGPSNNPTLDEDMLEDEESDSEEDTPGPATTARPEVVAENRRLREQVEQQARQISSVMELVTQLAAQVTRTPAEATTPKPKISTPEKYEGGRNELRAFLTNIDLYCGFNGVPNEQEKILMASMHMKGRAAAWMQPYVEDYVEHQVTRGSKEETRKLFNSWPSFKEEMGRIFGEVDAENQAEKSITRLKQTKSVSSYTSEFKQLQAKIDWDDAALRTTFENGLKEQIKDSLVYHEKPATLHELVELATRIDNRLWERSQQKQKSSVGVPNTSRNRERTKQVKIDRDGDIVMTDKIQPKSNQKRYNNNNGLSKEERQKRYDKNACLRCGEEGHFRRDCPKKEVRQGAVKIAMLRAGTPYPPTPEESSDELYEEARLQETFEPVPKVKEAQITTNNTRPISWIIDSAEVTRRLDAKACWVCGNTAHMAEDCERQQDIGITGEDAEDIAYRAIAEQPYFEDPYVPDTKGRFIQSLKRKWSDRRTKKAEETRKAFEQLDKERAVLASPEHATLNWTFCTKDNCLVHLGDKQGAGWFPSKRQKRSKN